MIHYEIEDPDNPSKSISKEVTIVKVYDKWVVDVRTVEHSMNDGKIYQVTTDQLTADGGLKEIEEAKKKVTNR